MYLLLMDASGRKDTIEHFLAEHELPGRVVSSAGKGTLFAALVRRSALSPRVCLPSVFTIPESHRPLGLHSQVGGQSVLVALASETC